VSDAMREHSRLARARSCDHQEGLGSTYGEGLIRVEASEAIV
jgi:hypothetical protein